VALHEHDKVLDEQIDDFKARIGAAEGNIQMLEKENGDL